MVSAIGHEQDIPLVDLVADVRAGTPSLAAKLIVPDHAAEAAPSSTRCSPGHACARGGAARSPAAAGAAGRAAGLRRSPETWITVRRERLEPRAESLRRAAADRVAREALRPAHAHDRLRLLGPAATLERGYAIVQDAAGAVVRDAAATVAARARSACGSPTGQSGRTVTEVHE